MLYCEFCDEEVHFDKNGNCPICGTPYAGDEDNLINQDEKTDFDPIHEDAYMEEYTIY